MKHARYSHGVEASTETRPDAEAALLAALWHRRPRVVVKADLLPAVSVLSFVALAGVPVGWIWSMLAPPTRMLIVAGKKVPVALPMEDAHTFDGISLHLVLGLAVGAVLGATVWLLRQRRGPVVMFAAVIGSLLAGWLALTIGDSIANSFYPTPSATQPGQTVVVAPAAENLLPVVAWGLGTSLAYGVLAVWNGMSDLGRRLS